MHIAWFQTDFTIYAVSGTLMNLSDGWQGESVVSDACLGSSPSKFLLRHTDHFYDGVSGFTDLSIGWYDDVCDHEAIQVPTDRWDMFQIHSLISEYVTDSWSSKLRSEMTVLSLRQSRKALTVGVQCTEHSFAKENHRRWFLVSIFSMTRGICSCLRLMKSKRLSSFVHWLFFRECYRLWCVSRRLTVSHALSYHACLPILHSSGVGDCCCPFYEKTQTTIIQCVVLR